MGESSKSEESSAPSWLDTAFLETALKMTVTSSSIQPVTSLGDNYTSDMYRVILKTLREGKEEELSIIIKASKSQDSIENFIFDREKEMYSSTLPAMSQILEEHNFQTSNSVFFPKLLHTQATPFPVIVMEDLKEAGFLMPERSKGLDVNQSKLVIRKLAYFHAASVALHVKDPDSMKNYKESVYSEEMRQYYEPYFVGNMTTLVEEVSKWPEYNDVFVDKLRIFTEKAVNCIIEVIKTKDTEFNVLTHGDLWSSNIMFQYSESSDEIMDVRFLDFQQCHWTSPVLDILYFIFTNPNEELWDNPKILLEEYHNTLNYTLTSLGLHHMLPSIQQLKCEFNNKGLFAVTIACVVLPLVLADSTTLSDVEDIMKKEKENFPEEMYSIHFSDECKTAMKKLLPLFERNGWL